MYKHVQVQHTREIEKVTTKEINDRSSMCQRHVINLCSEFTAQIQARAHTYDKLSWVNFFSSFFVTYSKGQMCLRLVFLCFYQDFNPNDENSEKQCLLGVRGRDRLIVRQRLSLILYALTIRKEGYSQNGSLTCRKSLSTCGRMTLGSLVIEMLKDSDIWIPIIPFLRPFFT